MGVTTTAIKEGFKAAPKVAKTGGKWLWRLLEVLGLGSYAANVAGQVATDDPEFSIFTKMGLSADPKLAKKAADVALPIQADEERGALIRAALEGQTSPGVERVFGSPEQRARVEAVLTELLPILVESGRPVGETMARARIMEGKGDFTDPTLRAMAGPYMDRMRQVLEPPFDPYAPTNMLPKIPQYMD